MEILDKWGNRLLRQCVLDNRGSGGKVELLGEMGALHLKLQNPD